MMLKEVKDGPHIQGASPQSKGQGPRENSLVSSPPLCLLGGLLCALPVLDSGISLERQLYPQASGTGVRRELEGYLERYWGGVCSPVPESVSRRMPGRYAQ